MARRNCIERGLGIAGRLAGRAAPGAVLRHRGGGGTLPRARNRPGPVLPEEILRPGAPHPASRAPEVPAARTDRRRPAALGGHLLEGVGDRVPQLPRAGRGKRLRLAIHRCRFQRQHFPVGQRLHDAVHELRCATGFPASRRSTTFTPGSTPMARSAGEIVRSTGQCLAWWVNDECKPLSSRFGWSAQEYVRQTEQWVAGHPGSVLPTSGSSGRDDRLRPPTGRVDRAAKGHLASAGEKSGAPDATPVSYRNRDAPPARIRSSRSKRWGIRYWPGPSGRVIE